MRSRKLLVVLVLLALLALLAGCRGDPTTVMTRLEEARTLVTSLRLDFRHVADASNRAVMADTDGASQAAARESEAATSAVEKHAAALAQLLQGLSYAQESGTLTEFRARFAEYRKLDARIVSLAVENTNLKAQALSFGPAQEAAESFASSLTKARALFPPKELPRADLLATQATLAVREVQVLFAPHIAERQEERMDQIEKKMAELDARAKAALQSLVGLAPADAKALLAAAASALNRFKLLTSQIEELSRRNTNVLSLDLALTQKPPLVAACQERLDALQAALAKEGPKSAR